QSFDDAVEYRRLVAVYQVIVAEKRCAGAGEQFGVGFGIVQRAGQRSAHQVVDAFAHESGDYVFAQGGHAQFDAHGVGGMGQVGHRVEQGAVQVEQNGVECGHDGPHAVRVPAFAISSRRAWMTAPSSGLPKMAEPATKVSAPAARICAILSTFTPPSTSSRMGFPLCCVQRSMRARASRSLASVPGMKLWPPKPGFTDIRSTTSSRSMTWSMASRELAGLNTRPAWQPWSRISDRVRCTWREASG